MRIQKVHGDTWQHGCTKLPFNTRHKSLEGVLYPSLLRGSSVTPPSYKVSWHCLTFTFARGASHHFSHNCHAQSKAAFSTDQKSLRVTNQDTHKTKSTHTPIAYGIKRELPPNKFISGYKWKYTQIHNLEHCVHICWGIFALQLLRATAQSKDYCW